MSAFTEQIAQTIEPNTYTFGILKEKEEILKSIPSRYIYPDIWVIIGYISSIIIYKYDNDNDLLIIFFSVLFGIYVVLGIFFDKMTYITEYRLNYKLYENNLLYLNDINYCVNYKRGISNDNIDVNDLLIINVNFYDKNKIIENILIKYNLISFSSRIHNIIKKILLFIYKLGITKKNYIIYDILELHDIKNNIKKEELTHNIIYINELI